MSILFHATNRDLSGSAIEPTRNFTCTREEQGDFVFAGEDIRLAPAYAFKVDGTHSAKLIEGTPILIVHDRDKYLSQLREKGTIITFSNAGFREVKKNDQPTGEWVSSRPLEISGCKQERISLRDAMRNGLQIFFINQSVGPEVYQNRALADQNPNSFSFISKMLREGILQSYNQELHESDPTIVVPTSIFTDQA
jgi:hypothetical protein